MNPRTFRLKTKADMQASQLLILEKTSDTLSKDVTCRRDEPNWIISVIIIWFYEDEIWIIENEMFNLLVKVTQWGEKVALIQLSRRLKLFNSMSQWINR